MGPEADLDVVGFGALNLDTIYRVDSVEVAGLEPGTEINGDEDDMDHLRATLERHGGPPVSISAGGSAANTIFALNCMGFRTGYVGAVGKDGIGERLLEGLGDPMDLGIVERGVSGHTVIAVSPDGDRSIIVYPNVNDTFGPEDVDHLQIAKARVLHLTAFVGNLPLGAQLEAVQRLPRDIKLTVDPGALYAARGVDGIAPILERADVVMPSEGELLFMTGEDSVVKAVDHLFDMGVEVVVCKRGRKGLETFWGGGSNLVQSGGEDGVKVTGDSVGAGDVANAGYIAGMISGLSPRKAGVLAHLCAVESLSGFGRDRYPGTRFLSKQLKELEFFQDR